MTTSPFRLYIRHGCPFCEQAITYFVSRRIPLDIVVDNDPITNTGIVSAASGMVPVLVCFITEQMVVGYKPDEYDLNIRAYCSSLIAGMVDGNSNESNDSGSTSESA